jgi:spore germination cell wall hydrolase CwlJ-like protein
MVAARTRALGARHSTHFWLGAFCAALMPTAIGYQDIVALVTWQPAAAHRTHRHLIASPFGTIEPATFNYGHHPIGTAIPRPPTVMTVNLDPQSVDQPAAAEEATQVASPGVNRTLKGDRLALAESVTAADVTASLAQPQPADAALAAQVVHPLVIAPPQASAAVLGAPAETPAAAAVARIDTDLPPEIPPAGQIASPGGQQSLLAPLSFAAGGGDEISAQINFRSGVTVLSSDLQRWAPGAEPALSTASFEQGIKLASLEEPAEDAAGGQGIAAKDSSELLSPAQRLGLEGKQRARAEKCLADAVYFEARGEPLRGQQAVAQVVMNRVFSGYYPNNVCGVVYQNAGRYLACQFTFACEHKNLDRIDEPDMWMQAKSIAKDTLDGKIWLPDIGHATHYHAYWVRPSWVHEMTKLYKLGVHTFYRPRAWGNGNYEPVWGTTPNKPEDGAKPQAAATPEEPAAKDEATARL